MSDEVFKRNVTVSLSKDEIVALYKTGMTFEDIELAEKLANEKKEKNVRKIWNENKKEIESIKDHIAKEKKLIKVNDGALDQKTIDYWVGKGYNPDQVYEAYVIGHKFQLKLDSVFEMIDSGEIIKLHHQLFQESLKKGGK